MPQQAIREAIDNVARAIAAHPEKGLVKNSPATASLTTDLTFSITGPKGEKAQTDATSSGLGTGPPIEVSCVSRRSAGGSERSRPSVYGCSGSDSSASAGPDSSSEPA